MSDRPGGGDSYTPNRKPRRGRGGVGTPRGRGQPTGDSSESPSVKSVSSPSVSSTTSFSSPAVGSKSPTPPITASSTGPSSPPRRSAVFPETKKSEAQSSASKVEEVSKPPSVKPMEMSTPSVSVMETPQERAKSVSDSVTSPETFSTPTSKTDADTSTSSIETTPQNTTFTLSKPGENTREEQIGTGTGVSENSSTESNQETAKAKMAESKDETIKTEVEKVSLIPEKPPRKTSMEREQGPIQEKEAGKKVYEADPAPAPKSPRTPGQEPPLTVKITETPKDTITVPEATNTSGASTSSSGGTGSEVPRKKSQVSPHGFAYGLGGPVGKPAYGISGRMSPEDPWTSPPDASSRIKAPSVIEISQAVKGFTGRQWTTLIIFGLADLFCAMVISLQAPFYPAEAEAKGATATEYGFVFGIYELTAFIMSPIYGKYMNKLGPTLMFNIGITTTAIACICFGLLDRINDHTMFITLSMIFRVIEAVGASAFVISTFTIIACEFPNSVATTFASLETFFGLGLIIGPTFGGALYQIGGFQLPFIATGGCLFILALMSYFVMPKIETVSDEDGNTDEGIGILTIMKIPSVFIASLAIASAASTVGFLSSTMEPHIRQFALLPVQTGLMFIISGGIYAFAAPGFGWICDKIKRPILITLLGAILMMISFIIIGPLPFIPINTMLWLVGVGLFIHGIGLAATFVSGFISGLKDSMEYGLPDNITTYGVVSGMWTSAISLGAFVGPSLGGILLDKYGFRIASWYPFASQLTIVFLVLLFILMRNKLKERAGIKDSSESEPLLRSIPPMGERKVEEVPSTSGSYGAVTGESQA